MAHVDPIFAADDSEQVGAFSKRDFFRIVFKHKWIILTTVVVVTVGVFWGIFYLPETFTTEAKVLIKTSEDAKPSFFSGITPIRERPDADPVNRVIETEMELVEAYPLSEKVVKEMNLGYYDIYHKPYMYLLHPVFLLYDRVLEDYFKVPKNPDQYTSKDPNMTAAFIKSLSVMPLKSKSAETNSNIIGIKLKSPNPKKAQEALERLIKYYTSHDVDLNDQASEKAETIVRKDLDEARNQVLVARERLRDYARTGERSRPPTRSGLAANGNGNGHGTGAGALAVGDRSLAAITTPRDFTSVDRLKAKLIDAESDLIRVKQTYSADSPNVRNLESTITALKRQIDREVEVGAADESTMDALERDVRQADSRMVDLDRKLEQIKLYREMNRKHVGNRIVIEPPLVPTSSDMKFKILIAVGASAASVLLGLLFAGVLEYTDHTLQTKAAVKNHLGLELLATIPQSWKWNLSSVTNKDKL